MDADKSICAVPEEGSFQVSCKANPIGTFAANAKSVVLTVSQRVRHENHEEMWNSVGIYAQQDIDGNLLFGFFSSAPSATNRFKSPRSRSVRRMHHALPHCGAAWLDHVNPLASQITKATASASVSRTHLVVSARRS